jgi:hypothetical protein
VSVGRNWARARDESEMTSQKQQANGLRVGARALVGQVVKGAGAGVLLAGSARGPHRFGCLMRLRKSIEIRTSSELRAGIVQLDF